MIATSRMTDPLTSHIAAGDHERTGQAQRQRDTCLDLVRRRPGLTAAGRRLVKRCNELGILVDKDSSMFHSETWHLKVLSNLGGQPAV